MSRHINDLAVYIVALFEQQAYGSLESLIQVAQCGDPPVNGAGG